MFDFVRKHTKIMMGLMFLLIIPAFVVVGVTDFQQGGSGGETVAVVGSQKITQAEWDAAHKNKVDQLRQRMSGLDPQFLESPAIRYLTLEELVRERVLSQAVKGLRVAVPDAMLARALQEIPEIAALRKPDGKLDTERYRELAAAQGLTPTGLEERIRSNMALQQVASAVSSTAFSGTAVANAYYTPLNEKRAVDIARFEPKDFVAQAQPSAADLEGYYQSNQKAFQLPESAQVEYVVLDLAAVQQTISVSQSDLQAAYQEYLGRLASQEQRRASHILIQSSKESAAADRAKAKEKAQAVLSQVRAAPEKFADLARQHSQDPGSAASGGDLNFFARGAMVKPFEEAVFSMKVGDTSEVVESDFGYHIIRLTDIKLPKKPALDEVRSQLEAELKGQQAQRKFAEMADSFMNEVYQQADGLQPVAQRFQLSVKTVSNVQRNSTAAQVGPLLANPKVLEALFTADSVEKKRNIEAKEVAPNTLVSARIVQHTPARLQPFAEVQATVRERWTAQRAAEMAREKGQAQLAAWKANPAAAVLPVSVTVSRQAGDAGVVPTAVRDAVMRAPAAQLPAWVGVDLGAQGYVVVRVGKVLQRNAPDEAVALQERNAHAQRLAQAEGEAYYEWLKNRFKAQIKVPKPERPAPL